MGLAIATISLSALAAEPVVVVEGLSQPTGLAVREGPRGGVEVVIAEAGAGRLTSVVLLGEERQSDSTLVEGLGAEPLVVAWAAEGTLLVAGEKLTAYSCKRPGEPATELTSAAEQSSATGVAEVRGTFSALAASNRHVFALRDGRLWRSRRLAEQLTEIRPIDAEPEGGVEQEGPRREERDGGIVGLAINTRGYLAVLVRTRLSHELRFLDPERPEAPGAATPITGLSSPLAMSYGVVPRPSEPLLYALEADGVYRIDASAPSLAAAQLVARVEGAQAMAFGPDGALYLVTADASRTGAVLRIAGEF
jgi:hypothetical protein